MYDTMSGHAPAALGAASAPKGDSDMTIFQAIFLGLVQGVTEFLPVSSSGHLSILQNFFGITAEGDSGMLFDVLLHLGTLVSVVLAYREDLLGIWADCRSFVQNLGHPAPGEGQRHPGARTVLMILIATLPLVLVLPVKDAIERLYYSTAFVGFMLILTGAMLYVGDRMSRGRKGGAAMTVKDALFIGVCQIAATIPGLSRSGTTITAGLSRGLQRSYAVKFSFLMSIPAVLGANLISLVKALGSGVDLGMLPHCILGMLAAMGSGYLAIGFLRRLVQQGKFGHFAYYCVGMGTIVMLVSIFI